ncbi:MAG TPA: hypothetical protein PKY59_18150 [Pyrinomonadaceae bacterium]|nr:hypothetical protein [Pyrinomonadaceae bacterium]
MKIGDKINKLRAEMAADKVANKARGDRMQKYACLAIKQGINGWAWHEYMRMFASNDDQLKRLVGQDQAFNDGVYGEETLAYVIADGVCGINTIGFDSRLSATMRRELDDNLDDSDDPNFA